MSNIAYTKLVIMNNDVLKERNEKNEETRDEEKTVRD